MAKNRPQTGEAQTGAKPIFQTKKINLGLHSTNVIRRDHLTKEKEIFLLPQLPIYRSKRKHIDHKNISTTKPSIIFSVLYGGNSYFLLPIPLVIFTLSVMRA